MLSSGNEIDSVRFSFFTAGSGGHIFTIYQYCSILSMLFLFMKLDILFWDDKVS